TDTTSGGGAGGELVTDRQGVEGATVRIVAQGSFVDPEVGEVVNGAGSGSGFVIDPEGIVVTNNHVVTGAATLEVFVNGEDEGRNAQILATSECSDLAVIDLEGDGYDYLEVAEEEIDTGIDVFAAGFPEGDPEYTITRGIVSKASASGETNWASVDSVIEHDATINPGNSGGPLVTDDGRVVGVNYAGDAESNQYFAIAQPTLSEVVDELRAGTPVDYLGINGQAVLSEDGGLSGIWVSAVESGSPAAELGLEGGDIVTKIEGLALATDGSYADYCDILRTQGTDGELSAQVLRFEADQFLEGAFNAGEELQVDEALSGELQGQTSVAEGGEAYDEYEYASDDSDTISVEVPTAWSGRSGAPLEPEEGGSYPRVIATPDLAGFNANFSTSGTVVLSLPGAENPATDATLTGLLDGIGATAACPEATGREDYSDALYTGRYELLTGCDGGDAAFAGVVAAPADGSFTAFVGVQLVTAADFDALDRILASFVISQ
ncbi:MAG: trypsin-like peptidase domain-containing protein, partial [Acidimicrobiia bacterium]|nr:trypsin-like peptidase domain-containing protein [Acidimicrobiia bacterium]